MPSSVGALCQAGPLCWVVLSQVFGRSGKGWRLSTATKKTCRRADALFGALSSAGVGLTARSNAIAHALTAAMKGGHAWSESGCLAFAHRRALAREFLSWIHQFVTLAVTTAEELRGAGQWWLAHYHDELRDERAGFEDYLDAAVVRSSLADARIRHVIVDHNHLPYLLGRRKIAVTSHYLR